MTFYFNPAQERSRRPPLSSPLVMAVVITALQPSPTLAQSATCESTGFDNDHSLFDSQLKRHVSAGVVDYSGWRSSGRSELERYLGQLEGVCQGEYRSWTRQQQLAFWINAYNAYTVKLILDNMPTSSIMKIGGGEGQAFKRRFIPLGKARGSAAKLSLNDVENTIIRRQFTDPRIHFALVCAAKSCPALRSEAYRGPALKKQLGAQARAFIRNGRANRYDAASNTLYLSRIFEWYGEDFQRGGNTVPSFVAQYLDGSAQAAIKAKAPSIEYLEYDWSLNGQ